MPELSRFFGIVITRYARDHGPLHFHTRYGIEQVVFLLGLDIPRLRAGTFPALGPRVSVPSIAGDIVCRCRRSRC